MSSRWRGLTGGRDEVVRRTNGPLPASDGLFVSHSGLDTKRIRDQLLEPAILPLVPGDAAFFHNRGSGAADNYKRLVHAALHWCDKFLIVVSDAAVTNEWVIAELDWAIGHTRPMVAACFDGRRFAELQMRCR